MHGSPAVTMSMVARMWSAYTGTELSPSDVCNMMVLLKVARFRANPTNPDNAIDAAGYAALAEELATPAQAPDPSESLKLRTSSP